MASEEWWCQKCFQPLNLSFEEDSRDIWNKLSTRVNSKKTLLPPGAPSSVLPFEDVTVWKSESDDDEHWEDNGCFMEIPAIQESTMNLGSVFRVASEISSVCHPLCTKCVNEVEKQLLAAQEDSKRQREGLKVLCSSLMSPSENGLTTPRPSNVLIANVKSLKATKSEAKGPSLKRKTIMLDSLVTNHVRQTSPSSPPPVHASTLASTAEDLTSETEEPASATPASGEDDIDPLFGGQLPRLPKLHRDPLEEYAELSASELGQEAQNMLFEIEAYDNRIETLKKEKAALEEQDAEVKQQETQLVLETNSFASDAQAFSATDEALQDRVNRTTVHLERLGKANVYNDAFHIWFNGHFATINGLHLGRLKSNPIEWMEINSAWGQCALLLLRLSEKFNIRFRSFKPFYRGSFSSMIRVGTSPPQHLQLYGAGRKMDGGMHAFLVSMKEVADHATQVDSHFKLKYEIEDDKVGGISIKYGNLESWTKACKSVATNLKQLLSHLT
eukprot:TRINITY_DN42208_c0_g1_i1.p1 TRINITY_DN42208_c0_g1~~TRINITY_DN42208_c0_g1_i1.p1  ORF type:complete len:501 (-),score=85.73 TRINITY_DN42208_c0_g1_i1:90-1592(-)